MNPGSKCRYALKLTLGLLGLCARKGARSLRLLNPPLTIAAADAKQRIAFRDAVAHLDKDSDRPFHERTDCAALTCRDRSKRFNWFGQLREVRSHDLDRFRLRLS